MGGGGDTEDDKENHTHREGLDRVSFNVCEKLQVSHKECIHTKTGCRWGHNQSLSSSLMGMKKVGESRARV